MYEDNYIEQVADFSLSNKVCNQICLPIKSHGCGLGKPVDTIAAAFVAHVEETLEAVTSVITAPYLEYFDSRFEMHLILNSPQKMLKT